MSEFWTAVWALRGVLAFVAVITLVAVLLLAEGRNNREKEKDQ